MRAHFRKEGEKTIETSYYAVHDDDDDDDDVGDGDGDSAQ